MKKGELYNSLLKGGLATLVLMLSFLYYTNGRCPMQELLLALLFILVFYFVQFVLGREPVIQAFVAWNGKNRWNVLLFPSAFSFWRSCRSIFSTLNKTVIFQSMKVVSMLSPM